jgi:DNA-binding NtrC family response regulator
MEHRANFRTEPTTDAAVLASRDAGVRAAFAGLADLAGLAAPALILGEQGSGRGAVARQIHRHWGDSAPSIVEVDCDELDSLELLETGDAGAVYLREIEGLDGRLQGDLAGLIRRGTARPRVLASGCDQLADMAARGRFDTALLAAFAPSWIRVPPLRARTIDIPDLVEFLLLRHGSGNGATPLRLAEAAMGYLVDYDWPGNIAELEASARRLCERTRGDFVTADDLPPQIRWFPGARGRRRACSKGEVGFNPLGEEFQLRLIADALRRTQRR